MGVTDILFYTLSFLSIYVQVFLLLTFIERRKDIKYRKESIELKRYPSVTVVVPCWNEEKTLYKTVTSLLALDYPKDKVSIFLVDDGSTDNTWAVMQQFEKYDQIEILHKENGGKHTAMNLGIERATTEFIGCLDADSFVHPQALKRIMTYFDNPEAMAVAPSIIVHEPKNLIQRIQKIEYNWGVFIKKMLGLNNAIHVTPGPFSFYRREIFAKIGGFRKAHNTEDMEIAYRMHSHHMKIEHANDAFVYTVAPNTVKKLYKQRLRWIHGFIKNTFDYRRLLFRREYGSFSFFTVPSGLASIVSVMFLFSFAVYHIVRFVVVKIEQFSVSGFSFHLGHSPFDWFYINTEAISFVTVFLYALVLSAMVIGTRMAEGKAKFSLNFVWFMLIYSIIAPFWLLRAVYNAVFAKKTAWR